MSFTTLSEQSIQILRARGYDAPLQNGFRCVSNSSYISEASADSQATVEIPNQFESVETFIFIELRPEAAQFAFDNFLQLQAQFPDMASIQDSARRHVLSIQGDAYSESDDWIAVMNRIGLTTNFQNRVMDPAYKELRLTGSAKHWAMEMMAMRLEFLQSLDDVIKSQGPGPNRKVSCLDLSGQLKYNPPHPVPSPTSSRGKGPAVGTFQTSGPSIATTSESPPTQIAGHQMFYKGGTLVHLKSIFFKDNKLSIRRITSTPPGDFTADFGALYLTKQTQVAWQYAQWVKKIVDGKVVPTGILQIAIPNHLLASITQVVGDEWRKLVWNSRRVEPEDASLVYLRDYQWLTGPLCHLSPQNFLRLSSPAEIEIWKLKGGESASQHYTASASMFKMIEDACVDKVWVSEMAREGAGEAGDVTTN